MENLNVMMSSVVILAILGIVLVKLIPMYMNMIIERERKLNDRIIKVLDNSVKNK